MIQCVIKVRILALNAVSVTPHTIAQSMTAAASTKLDTIEVVFYRTDSGVEPVRDWLKSLPMAERRAIGEDLKAVQFRMAVGHAAGAQAVRQGLGNTHTTADAYCTCVVHGEKRQAGVAARLHQKNTSDTADRITAGGKPVRFLGG